MDLWIPQRCCPTAYPPARLWHNSHTIQAFEPLHQASGLRPHGNRATVLADDREERVLLTRERRVSMECDKSSNVPVTTLLQMLLPIPHRPRNRGRYVLYVSTLAAILYLICLELTSPGFVHLESQGSYFISAPPCSCPFVGQNTEEPQILLVSACFPFPKSKYIPAKY